MTRPGNQRLAGEATELIGAVSGLLEQLTDMRSTQAALTASATVEHGRITVVVDATGAIIETVYAEGIDELSYGQIARATVQAAQAAAATVARKHTALLAPIEAMRAGMSAPIDLPPDLAALRAQLPEPARAPLTPPAERTAGETRAGQSRILDR
ncbi:hypothetical protein [Nocardia rhizosphaerihabitans]|uniref:YbaB/EbfC DNA-binding family protein n=1 Tax=Nocardia rhizosphaerihabitans TaxID=1691570 RepID=A0ABQ2L3J7_9NOCA|nr:hypothetical protein [Nocardia rhizosphaerihabitans]GGO01343.1 hypothetical protein GCM10011610_71050 [Nocardia rhizosphaerihabitans]